MITTIIRKLQVHLFVLLMPLTYRYRLYKAKQKAQLGMDKSFIYESENDSDRL